MMTHRKMAQYPLSLAAPTGVEPRNAIVNFSVTLTADGRDIILVMEDMETGKDYIAIKEHSDVKIVLRGDQIFFSKEHDGITMKDDDLGHLYGGLEYGDYDKELDRYRSVKFVACFNKGGKVGTKHPFNINVDLLQGGSKAPRWIGLTIDPDITNPPPPRD
ncbi:hypothetical protein SAMN05444678_101245 [Sphingomonas sp. YR710]|jgi:hypothetical protein|uniref:nucleotide synthetase n=1 Tax=Sphingomonas sp. YR710 TaxID=1882773 RepID=UPI00088C257C|nr:nucleotide synthetase [Sphingomonas sp. YR710]SDC05812.1 hypothetical protein SAMN05444678_101245 [Sphingomonas sp. YR710]